jgi:hypothetical protein
MEFAHESRPDPGRTAAMAEWSCPERETGPRSGFEGDISYSTGHAGGADASVGLGAVSFDFSSASIHSDEELERQAARIARWTVGASETTVARPSRGSSEMLKPARAQESPRLGPPVPRLVGRVVGAPGVPLACSTRAYMERRLGINLEAVRVHADARAAQSARAVGSLAYTVGTHVVFDSGRYAPQTAEGRQLLAHELVHVAQQSGVRGMRHGPTLQRKYRADGQGGWLLTFTVGDEIAADLAAEAYTRTTNGALGDGDLATLRDVALRTDRSIDDNERMFIAALLSPANAAQLHNEQPNAFAQHASITFRGATITAENRARVEDYGRQPPTPMALRGGATPGYEQRIIGLAGPGFAQTAKKVIALARADKLPLETFHQAMLAAASDSTSGDRVLAGAAYVIARRARLPVATDLLSGAIKIDEVPPSYISGTAEYVTLSTLNRKGDTIYLPTNFDVTSIAYQGLLVHELTHAAHDKTATQLTNVPTDESELEGYLAQARYWLLQASALKGAAQAAAIADVAAGANPMSIWAMVIEDRAHPVPSPVDVVAEVQRLSPYRLTDDDWEFAQTATEAQLKSKALKAIRAVPIYRNHLSAFEGLKGESFLDD